ncbi:SUN domain-containing protein 1 isoform X2 [Triplophysa rosa]|uniref:SUN domain-containing protein 1 isoform X2 n=1 Tax=Triplophysa rosa TaxID=992332 RepID=UPI0025463729|nr:SUN domain-containing protein 1 isoform X2 [Triplophysa rosa]
MRDQQTTMDFSRLHTYTPPHCTPDNTGYTYSLSSSYSTAALEFEKEHKINPVYDSPRMSRRSLRLQTSAGFYGDGSFAELTQNHNNSSYKRTSTSSVSRSVRSRRQQQESSMYESHSVNQTPQKDQTDLSIISTASDASLISSLLDESALRQSSTTHACSARRRRTTDHSSLLENGDASRTETRAKMANGYICKDCCFHADLKTDEETACSLAYSSSVSSAAHQTVNSVDKTVHDSYCGSVNVGDLVNADRRLNLNGSLCDDCKGKQRVEVHMERKRTSYTRSVFAALWALVTYTGSGLLGVCSGLGSAAAFVARKMKSVLWLAVLSPASSSSVSTAVHQTTADAHMNVIDKTGDAYEEAQQHYFYARHIRAALWALVSYTGSGLLRVCSGLASAAAFVARTMKSVLWLAVLSPGKAASGLFWWLGTGWYQLVTLMSFMNVFILTRCLPKLLKLLLFLLPFLLLFGLWYLGPASFLTCLPAVNLTEWKTLVPSFASLPALPSLPSLPSLPALPAFTSKALVEEHHVPPEVTSRPVSDSITSKRLVLLEQRVVALWENIQQGELKAQQQHQETVGLVQALHEQINTQTDRDHLRLWVSQLFEPKFTEIKGEMDRDASSRAQTEEQHVQHQTNLEARLAELELLLQNLNTRTTEIHVKHESPAPAPVSVGVSQEKHDALLLEVQRLEAELGRIRGDLQGVMGCQGKCDRLDTIHETVSAQVREQLYALLYGHNRGEVEIPEPLLPWLASQYMRSSDLTATLTMLERSILGNVSLQLQEIKPQQSTEETVTQTIVQTARAAGISEEQVQLIVQRALKLYSEDRTGQVDYALESGGGSILSTRCSETYETKTALMSLFGLPLWYFSQSPRVVIQPDMYPGNCWAFKGSHGYLVIRLSLKVLPTSFCLEHIPKSLSPSGNISSAPRRFTVYGLDDEYQEEAKLLGDYTYQDDGDSLQIFPVMENNDKAFQIIEMRVLSNWGHPEYTCLYRFRVHGRPHAQ